MADADAEGGSGFGPGLIVALIAIGGVLFLLVAGFAFFGMSYRSGSAMMTGAVAYPSGTAQETGGGAWGTYAVTRSSDGFERSWAVVRIDPSGNLIAAVFGHDLDPPHEAETDYSSFTVKLDLTTDATLIADGSKPLQVVTPRGVRELKPTLTGPQLSSALQSINTHSILASLRQVADTNEVDAILQSVPAP